MKRLYMALGFILALAGAIGAWRGWEARAARPAQNAAARAQAVPVTVATVVRKPMPYQIQVIGAVQTQAGVAVRSRVDSQIAQIHFKEGDAVKEGDLLFTLDSRSLEAQLRQAQAQLAKDQAQHGSAQRDVERYTALLARDFASHQQAEQAQANAAVANASIAADQAGSTI